MTPTNIVTLNVGGTVFQTTKSTLTKYDSFFKTMFETGIPLEKDEAGCIFIDRSPKHFEKILNFLRDGNVAIPESKVEVHEIEQEAQYYLLTGLIQLCKGPEDFKVTLNVGGKLFHTTTVTLKKMRRLIFRGKFEGETGIRFIDRSLKHFGLILDYLRDDGDTELPNDLKELSEIDCEAKFYGIEDLSSSCHYKRMRIQKANREY